MYHALKCGRTGRRLTKPVTQATCKNTHTHTWNGSQRSANVNMAAHQTIMSTRWWLHWQRQRQQARKSQVAADLALVIRAPSCLADPQRAGLAPSCPYSTHCPSAPQVVQVQVQVCFTSVAGQEQPLDEALVVKAMSWLCRGNAKRSLRVPGTVRGRA
jgi:hypothetical protein